MSYGREMRAKL